MQRLIYIPPFLALLLLTTEEIFQEALVILSTQSKIIYESAVRPTFLTFSLLRHFLFSPFLTFHFSISLLHNFLSPSLQSFGLIPLCFSETFMDEKNGGSKCLSPLHSDFSHYCFFGGIPLTLQESSTLLNLFAIYWLCSFSLVYLPWLCSLS